MLDGGFTRIQFFGQNVYQARGLPNPMHLPTIRLAWYDCSHLLHAVVMVYYRLFLRYFAVK